MLILGSELGSSDGAVLITFDSIMQAVSQVTAVWAMALPIIVAFVPIVIADPASTLPTKMLAAPMVKPVPKTQKTLSALAPLRSTIWLLALVVRVVPILKTNWAFRTPLASRKTFVEESVDKAILMDDSWT